MTLVILNNPYTESELAKLAENYEKEQDKTSVAITRATEARYLKTLPDMQ